MPQWKNSLFPLHDMRLLALLSFLFALPLFAADTIGVRPYEMVNAGRTADTHPPLVDFENLDGWTVETVESEASFSLSREQQLWGDSVGKLTYKNVPMEQKTPLVTLKPPKPLPIGKAFDCINFWLYGNNWAWEYDPKTPQVSVTAILRGSTNSPLRVPLGNVNWKEWFLLHKKLSAEELAALGGDPAFEAIEIRGGTNVEERTLFFDNLSFFKAELPPLEFEPRPLRNIKLPKEQTTGTNTGPETLPFPHREETILPTCLSIAHHQSSWEKRDNESYFISNSGKGDENHVWRYTPKSGTLDDLNITIDVPINDVNQLPEIALCLKDSGIRFVDDPKEPPQLLSVEPQGETLTARWKFGVNEVEYRFTMKQKSLIVDVCCLGGNVKEFSSGGWTGLSNAKLVKVPYLVGNGPLRPAVVVAETELFPLFILSMLDHTRSNASEFFWEHKTGKDYVSGAACSRYTPKTDGTRNDFFERLFITLSPVFEEVLPNIPNDKSPWKHVTAERVWHAHGASNHDRDYEFWSRIKRYGMEKMLVTDHETLWRDGGESFTFRTYAAPGKGGDEGQKDYTQKMHELGFIYGPYNNYTDFSPVNEYWNEDWASRLSDGNWRPAWARCYNAKPAIAVQTEPKITEIIQSKFGFNTAYCDVHTAVRPWEYVDYDARVPGAGTFAATFYAYGEILLHQKKIWNGPVYSEGNNHWYYSGLTDGNYAQDQAYFVHENDLPWIVDFDLLKIHPLENNFGMGNCGMFYGGGRAWDTVERGSALDRFLAATLAFGHTGFLAMEFGLDGGARSYFTVQQIAARCGTQNVKSIRYADKDGKLLTTSQAIASDAVKLNRICVEYEDGLTIYVNGNSAIPYEPGSVIPVPIPPNGWYVHDPTGKLTAWSLDIDGRRTDYVDSPEYLFANIRDNPKGKPTRFDRLLCDNQIIVRKNIDSAGRWEMIVGEPHYAGRSTLHAVRLDDDADADAVALDFHGRELGNVGTRYSRGMVHVMPVDGAFSYLLTPKKEEPIIRFPGLPGPFSKQNLAVPGEDVMIQRYDTISNRKIATDAKPNTLYWFDDKLDFDVLPLCNVSATITENNRVDFQVQSNVTSPLSMVSARVEILCDEKIVDKETMSLDPKKPSTILCPMAFPQEPSESILELRVLPGGENSRSTANPVDFVQKYRFVTELGFPALEKFPDKFESGYCFRNGNETAMDDKTGAHAYAGPVEAGGKTQKGWGIHPPYNGGVGYTFLLSEPVVVPNIPNLVFAMDVGIRSGGDKSDGVLYKIVVILPEPGTVFPVAGILWDKKSWGTLQADLSPWAGKTVRLKLIADVGPNDNSVADWACIANIRWEVTKATLQTRIEEVKP